MMHGQKNIKFEFVVWKCTVHSSTCYGARKQVHIGWGVSRQHSITLRPWVCFRYTQ